jgi:hypothetical protein
MSKDMIIHISVPEVMRVPVWSGEPSKRWLDDFHENIASDDCECDACRGPMTTNQPSHVWVWSHHGGMCGIDVSLAPHGNKMIDDWHLHYGLCEAVGWAMGKMSYAIK